MYLHNYKDIVGNCAFVTTMAHMLTGTLICKDIYQKGTAKGCDPMPFIGGIGMCVLMLKYALILQDPAMININLFGVATNVAYMLVYYIYSPHKADVMNKLGKATLFVALVLGYAQIESKEHVEYRYGILTTILFLVLIGSPLFNLGEIIRTKSTAMLPFPLIFMGTVVAFQWLIYGLIINNSFIILQNFVGLMLSLAQLSLFAIYPSQSNDKELKIKSDKKEK
ncbi:sugar transporter SWEET1-like [Phymastichus coffea]|uniref:sugar transporter SWEET1-like n=1 Tax=Phymastichus coffea TaxID=108790 RepID=UPI00273A78F4|nr:sugar transporter SWEET1-like [Phymastichus coffea]